MADTIPPVIYKVVKEFLEAGKSGTITLNANSGRIESAQVSEYVKVAKS